MPVTWRTNANSLGRSFQKFSSLALVLKRIAVPAPFSETISASLAMAFSTICVAR